MRRDRQLFEAVDQDRNRERNESGCCVRLDGPDCVQEPDDQNCRVNHPHTHTPSHPHTYRPN